MKGASNWHWLAVASQDRGSLVPVRLPSGSTPPPYAGGQIFSVPLFHARQAFICGLPRNFLVDAAGHISPVFNLRTRISLFFLCCLVDVSISWTHYSCGFQRSGWTLPMAEHRGVELVKRSSNTCLRLFGDIPCALKRSLEGMAGTGWKQPFMRTVARLVCSVCGYSRTAGYWKSNVLPIRSRSRTSQMPRLPS